MDEVLVVNRVLTPAEITRHFNSGDFFDVSLDAPIFDDAIWWPRADGSDNTTNGAVDRTFKGNVGSTVGMDSTNFSTDIVAEA